MSSWLTFVIGVILGLLIGWLIDLLYRRRTDTTAAQAVESRITLPERAVPLTAAAPLAAAAAVAEKSEPPDWPAMSERVAEVAEETEPPATPPAYIAAEMPVVGEGLPPAAVAALAAQQAEERASGAAAPASEARDRLILIEGIGPVYEAKLHAAGIHTFRQLFEAGDDRLAEIIEPKSWQRLSFAEWREQAQLLAEGKDQELKDLQARLFSRKKG